MTGGMRLLLDRIQSWCDTTDWVIHWQSQQKGMPPVVSAQEELLLGILESIDIRSLARDKVLLSQILKSLHEIHINKRNIS